jgi:DnaJ-like protein
VSGFESWIDRQIREARERGEFDNLPGAGKPIPGLKRQDENWWVKGLMKRENLEPVLPTSLSLRKESEQLLDRVAQERTEEAVREIVTDLNERILDSRRRKVDGPQIWLRTFNVDRVVEQWRDRRSGEATS